MESTPDPQLPSDDLSLPLEEGFLVGAGRYTLRRLIGQGHSGVVWLAWDDHLEGEVALKFLTGPIALNSFAVEEMRRAIGRTRNLSHPNILRVHDFHHLAGEPAFISMEYVAGGSLGAQRPHQPQGLFSWTVLQPWVVQACSALEYAHGEGFIHGGIRPSNLFLDERGRLKVANFGLSIPENSPVIEGVDPQWSQAAIGYMSPQQLDGTASGISDDVYGLGATLYDLLTGAPPFHSDDIERQIRKDRPQPIAYRLMEAGLKNEVPPYIAALVLACLAKHPEQRPGSARAVGEEIEPIKAGQASSPSSIPPQVTKYEPPVSTPEAPPLTTPGQSPEVAGETDLVEQPGPEAVPRPKVPRWIGALAAVVLAFLGWIYFRPQRPQSSQPADRPSPTILTEEPHGDENQVAVSGQPPSDSVAEHPSRIPETNIPLMLSGHLGVVNSVAFSSGGKAVASGSFDGTARLWDTFTGESRGPLEGHHDQVKSVAFSPDGGTLATAGQDRIIRLWDVAAESLKMTLDGVQSTVFMVAFSPDRKTLASAEENGVITLWDYTNGKKRQSLQAHTGSVWSLAFSPDGRILASGGMDQQVRLWNPINGKPIKSLSSHTESVHSVAFSSDGSYLASSARDKTIILWRLADGRMVRRWSTGNTIGHALAFAKEGKGFVSANEDGSIGVWSMASDVLLTNLVGHVGVVHTVAFSPDGKLLASGGDDAAVRLWDWEQLVRAVPQLDEFIELCNGRDLTGWRGKPGVWSVEDGMLSGSAPVGQKLSSFLTWSGGRVGDFELRFVFRSREANSGVLFRAKEPSADQLEGYQYEIWSDQTGMIMDVRGNGDRRDLALLGQRTVATENRGVAVINVVGRLSTRDTLRQAVHQDGWNEGVIIARGNRIVQKMNGLLSAEVSDRDSTRYLSEGLLSLEVYTEGDKPRTIQFKSIRLRKF